jgi:hypothetical protein
MGFWILVFATNSINYPLVFLTKFVAEQFLEAIEVGLI